MTRTSDDVIRGIDDEAAQERLAELESAVVEAAIGWSYQVVCESVADDALLAAVTDLLRAREQKPSP